MPSSTLRSRRSAAQLHAIARVEQEIRAIDPVAGRKYLRAFREAYNSYEKVLDAREVAHEIAATGIALVGDYHALPNSQHYVAALIREPALRDRPVVLGLETIFSRDQHILDEWYRHEIEEAELRQRIRFDLDWGYDWSPFYELISTARDQGASIYGLDCTPREDLRKIRARDRHAANKIAELRNENPDALVIVLFGESHLAPTHLPALLQQRLPNEPILTILQNVDALYWLAAGEARDHVEAVAVSKNVFCVFNATPLEKYENYRLCLDRWGRNDSDNDIDADSDSDAENEDGLLDGQLAQAAPDLAPTLHNLIEGLARFIGIHRQSQHNTTQPRLLVDQMPEVYSRTSHALLGSLLSRKGFTPEQRDALLGQVQEKTRGSIYLAALNAIYVSEFRMSDCAEDATRFLHQACRGLPNLCASKSPTPHSPKFETLDYDASANKLDVFYTAVFEHALAFFGSRILYPARPAVRDSDLQDLFDITREDLEQQTSLPFVDAVEAVEFLIEHRKNDDDYQTPPFTGRKYDYVAQQLGYLTGNNLYDAYLAGRFTTAALRKLFLTHIENPGTALESYTQLRMRLQEGGVLVSPVSLRAPCGKAFDFPL
jgi:Haem-binding uptake, Tiki superfamily, ChaN